MLTNLTEQDLQGVCLNPWLAFNDFKGNRHDNRSLG